MSRRLVAALCGLAAVAVAAPARAHPERPPDLDLGDLGDGDGAGLDIAIGDPPPPPLPEPPPAKALPPPPREPRVTSLGWRLAMTTLVIDDHERRSAASFGLQAGVVLSRHLRGYAEYQFLAVMSGDTDGDTRPPPQGSGHLLAGGLRLTLLDTTIKKLLRLYVDADGLAGVTAATDSALGTRLVPIAEGGIRFGYELLRQHRSPASSFDAHIVVRMTRTEAGSGFMFGVGMEWGG